MVLSADAQEKLMNYGWPGNIRQLRNVIERAVVLAKSKIIGTNDLPAELLAHDAATPTSSIQTFKQMELQAITEALHECSGNKSQAAKKLGISRKTFYKRLLTMPPFPGGCNAA